jgi:hypothetical protein
MESCTAIKTNGHRCTAAPKNGTPYCGRHGGNEMRTTLPCRHRYAYRGQRRQCPKDGGEGGYCPKHFRIVERKRKRRESLEWMRRTIPEIMRLIWDENDPVRAVRLIEMLEAEGRFIPLDYMTITAELGNEVARYDQSERVLGRRPFAEPVFPPVRPYDPLLQLAGQEQLWGPQGTPERPGLHPMWLDDLIVPPPIPEGLGEMGRLAYDTQNVHTREVNENVSNSLDLLLGVRDPVNGFEGYWSNFPVSKDNRKMHNDMKKWYDTEFCRTPEDWLYRKALDGLWTLIDRSPFRDELMVRLTQEADESVGMCCDGHIARLCNVMVGFDDAFRAPVSVTDILGDRIAAIAAMDLPVEAKVIEAWGVFEELHVDHETRKDWISAF